MSATASEHGAWRWLERGRTIVEIAAIGVGGWWAWTRFSESDANRTMDLHGAVEWSDRTATDCRADYEIEAKNVGKRSLTVQRAVLSTWAVDGLPELVEGKQIAFHDLDKAKLQKLDEHEVPQLAHEYAPEQRDQAGFSFAVRRAGAARILFRLDLWRDDSKEPTDWDYRWQWVCGERPQAPSASAVPTSDRAVSPAAGNSATK